MGKGILWLSVISDISLIPLRFAPAKHLHITLQFGAIRADWEHLIGERVAAIATADCSNERVQALKVELPDQYKLICGNPIPHITLSHLPEVKPVESNKMLESPVVNNNINLLLDTEVEFFNFI